MTMTPDDLRAWLDRHGGNVTRLASELGVSRNAVYRWLDGSRNVSETAARLMAALDRIDELEG